MRESGDRDPTAGQRGAHSKRVTTYKHAFDVSYYQILDSTQGRPFGLYLHGNQGAEGAVRAVDSITGGLGWTKAAERVIVSGAPGRQDREPCWELGATVAANLMEG
ncbi:hypothetical protein ABID74_000932 [Gordonia terrae]